MINFDDVTKGNTSKHKLWLQIPDHIYRIFITGGSGSGKINALVNLIKQQQDHDYGIDDKIYLHVKDTNDAKYQHLIKNRKNNDLKNLNDWKNFIEYSYNIQNVYKLLKSTTQSANAVH